MRMKKSSQASVRATGAFGNNHQEFSPAPREEQVEGGSVGVAFNKTSLRSPALRCRVDGEGDDPPHADGAGTKIWPRIAVAAAVALTSLGHSTALAQPDPNWLGHDRTRPLPPAVDPGTPSTLEEPGKPPADAVVLFDGTDLSQWVALVGSATKWTIRNGAMECVPGSGYVRTLQCFGDCQLHVEWAAPTPGRGEGQGRGNSGVFFGLDRYELQVLDSYENKTYSDGSAASVYNQYPPLVNASRPPGQWQFYDIVWTAPRFDGAGKLHSPARVTMLHNGVLVQNNVELTGPTTWLTRPPYSAHPEKLPISFQDHGNPVRFRNVWVRELGKPGKKEFLLPNAALDGFT